ncbi:helix-turn-helix domain-containing protein [Streptomyces sp. H27-G5]|uniref:helix-turn-helix transcriptional regulator n=1 Tax=Streptomyces sp. H27-G5 TaxID=2996698 RepID=UPI002271F853|nr:helix-turn-helix domain-containing protein [Streptomyces sp. H27-G5]MCY0922353.1 helix-turn-helix domain-containing protein [Streptomyces sp. H27-G5]
MLKALLAFEKPRGIELPSPEERARIRKEFGISQKNLGDLLGVTRLSVSMWERGETDPQGENRKKYAEALAKMAQRLQEGAAGEGDG